MPDDALTCPPAGGVSLTPLTGLGAEGPLQQLLDAMPAHAALLDQQGCIVAVNAAWRRFWLAQRDPSSPLDVHGHLGLNYLEISHRGMGTDAEATGAAVAGIGSVLAGTRALFSMEYPCRGPGGDYRFRLEASPFAGAGCLVAHWDITDAWRQAEALRISEERYRAVVEDQTEVISRFDHQGVFSFVNEVYCRFFGKTAGELIGGRWHPVAHPDDVAAIEAGLSTLSPDNPVVTIENRVFSATGEIRWMQFVNRAFFDQHGQISEIQSVGRDITQRKAAELAQRQGEAHYHTLVDTLAEGVLVFGPEGRIRLCNPAAVRILGVGQEVLLGAGQSGPGWVAYGEDLEPLELADLPVSRSQREGVAVHGAPIGLRRPDGSLIWLSVNSVPLPLAEDGGQSGVLATLVDMTAERSARQALQESEARYRALVESSPDAIIVGQDDRVVLVNPACLRLLGARSAEDLLGRPLRALFPADFQGLEWALCASPPAPDLPVPTLEERIPRLDGGWVDVEMSASPVGYEGGQALHVVMRDITRRKRREQEIQRLARSERALGQVARALGGDVEEAEYLERICRILVEECGHAMAWIGMAEDSGNLRPAARAGRGVDWLVGDGLTWRDEEFGHTPMGSCLRRAKPVYCRDLETEPGGAPWRQAELDQGFRSSASLPLLDVAGRAFGAIQLYALERDPFSRDEEKLMELLALDVAAGVATLRLRQENTRTAAAMAALRSEMQSLVEWQVAAQTAASIAHELNQPLNAITAFGEAARIRLGSVEALPDILARAMAGMVEQADRAGQILRELMAFFHHAEAPREGLDLVALAREAVDLAASVGALGVPVHTHAASGLRPVLANRLHIEKVFLNLLRNATEAMAESPKAGDHVRLSIEDGVTHALVTLRDTGPGLDWVAAKQIFEPFHTTKKKGIGMGLTISRALVEAHGGRLWCESAPGLGATFRFTLPYLS